MEEPLHSTVDAPRPSPPDHDHEHPPNHHYHHHPTPQHRHFVSANLDYLEPCRALLFRVQHHVAEWIFRRPPPRDLALVESYSIMRYQFLRVFCLCSALAIAITLYCGFDLINGDTDNSPAFSYELYLPLWYMCIPLIQDFTRSTSLATIVLIFSVTAGVTVRTATDDGFTILGASNANVIPVLATLLLGSKGGIATATYFLGYTLYLYFKYLNVIGEDLAELHRAQVFLSGYMNVLVFNLFLVVLQDYIRHRYIQELVSHKEEAMATSRQKTQFVSLVSHELRNPLSAVLSIVDLVLNNDHHMSEDTRNSIQLVHNATEDLLRILNDILDATKLGAAKMALVSYDFDLHELAVDRCYVLSTLCADKGLEMVLDFPRTVPSKFRGDAGRIRQVMSNLITNAVKFTDKGSITVSFRVEGNAPGHATIVCRVRDTGCGIPKADQHKLFEEFSQVGHADAPRQIGSGLGLFLVKRLVELMHGSVFMESTPGVGSEFGFKLPLEKQVGVLPEWAERNIDEEDDEEDDEEEGGGAEERQGRARARQGEQVRWNDQVDVVAVGRKVATAGMSETTTTISHPPHVHSQHRHRSLDMNNSTILSIVPRPFYLFSQNTKFGEYLERMCVEGWCVERFERMEVEKEADTPTLLGSALAQYKFKVPRRGEDELPAVFLIDLSPEPKPVKRGLYGQANEDDDDDDDDDEEEVEEEENNDEMEDEGVELTHENGDPVAHRKMPPSTPTPWTTHPKRVKTQEEEEDEILHSTLEEFTRAFLARALLGPATANPATIVRECGDFEDDDEDMHYQQKQMAPRQKDTIIFFHSFRQFHRVRPSAPLCRAYNVSVCRKPVTEREVLSMIRHPRKIGGVNGSSAMLFPPRAVQVGRRDDGDLNGTMAMRVMEEQAFATMNGSATEWMVQMEMEEEGRPSSTKTRVEDVEDELEDRIRRAAARDVVVVTAGDGHVRKASPEESSPKKVDSGFGIVPDLSWGGWEGTRRRAVELSEREREKVKEKEGMVGQGIARTKSMPHSTPAPGKAGTSKMPRVLVVEDNNVNRILVKQQLKSLGMRHVDIAVDGLEAVQKFALRSDYGLILMDMHVSTKPLTPHHFFSIFSIAPTKLFCLVPHSLNYSDAKLRWRDCHALDPRAGARTPTRTSSLRLRSEPTARRTDTG
ncbi:hypothetical protein BC936DRAFT_138717 [Jimgerdemannia flammicorona]|uniref:histidine kinase n=1 Tax=Jimgerdemannia flammicorona TaxID=994334 RepID=A0A433BQC0_9FUNG|nr:hypothetical protein BC936DRAFT_138717 [Jimgerdemannia flammicorona]